VKVLVAEQLSDEGLAPLRERHQVDVRLDLTRDQLLEVLPGYDALLVRSQVRVDAEALAAGSNLLVVGRAGVGTDNIDLDAATRAGVTVVNAPTANTIAAAEHTLALLYALARRIPAADASVRRGEWKRAAFLGQELRGRTLGIVGLGRIGLSVADRARAMEMELLGHDPFVTEEAAAQHGVRLVPLPELLERADAITLHVPLSHATRGLIGADELALMKPAAVLVNVARGGVVDEAALADALRGGRLAGAAIDVFEDEPPKGSPLLEAPNTVLTPHLGASTEEAQARVAMETVQQVLDVLDGRSARYAVNAPLVSAEIAAEIAPYLPLARALGMLYAQFAPSLEGLTLELAGEVAGLDARPIAAAALSGLLELATEGRVNQVNAPLLAAERGLQLAERRTSDSPRYQSVVSITGATTVAGTVSGGEPRIVRLADYWVDMPTSPWMLITRHRDRPGTMGTIGLMLGQADVNISAMHLGRSAPRADALMVLALDDPAPEAVAAQIRGHEAVLDLWLVNLSP
jgi:D-3-phosphoglycerate dehydrogenase / 2-oxoglutarate reductase